MPPAEDFAALKGMPVALTGASGFIGGHLARALLERGARLRVLARHPRALTGLAGAEPIRGGLGDAAALDRLLDGAEILFHFAHDMRAGAAENLSGLSALLAAAAKAGTPRIVAASSAVVEKNWPHGAMGAGAMPARPDPPIGYRGAKAAGEHELAGHAAATGSVAISLRPTLVYGPGSRIWTAAIAERLIAGPVILPDPPGQAFAVHVADVVRAALSAAMAEVTGHAAVLISGPEPVGWEEYYRAHIDILGRGEIVLQPREALLARIGPPGPEREGQPLAARLSALMRRIVPGAAVDALGARLRALKPHPAGPQAPDPWLLDLYCAAGSIDPEPARTRIGFSPSVDFAAGMEMTAPWLRQRYG